MFSHSSPVAHVPCRILIGPLILPHILGDFRDDPKILSFGYPEALEWYYAWAMEPQWYRLPPASLELDFERAAQLSLRDLWAQLPPGWEPELLIWWGFFFPIPADIAACPVPTLLVVADWHGYLSAVLEYVGVFDHILCDRALLQLLRARGHEHCGYWPCYSWNPAALAGSEGPRDLDVSFIGTLNPALYHQRNHYLERLARLAPRQRIFIGQWYFNRELAAYLWRSKIVFNHALRAEMNIRAYEAAACGALLLIEESNLEVADFLPPGEACVTYNRENFEAIVDYYLGHDAERDQIAGLGRELIQAHSYTQQFSQLLQLLPELIAGLNQRCERRLVKVANGQSGSPGRLILALQMSRLGLPPALEQAVTLLQELHDEQPGDPVTANALACCLCYAALAKGSRLDRKDTLARARKLLEGRLAARSATDPILLLNLAWICWFCQDQAPVPGLLKRVMARLSRPDFGPLSLARFADFVLPPGGSTFALAWERLPEQFPEASARWQAARKLLIWNGLQLQSQLGKQSPVQAAEYLRAACGLCPELPDAWLGLAQLEVRLGRIDAGLEAFRQGLSHGGLFPWVFLAAIPLLLARGRLDEAMSELTAAETLFHGPGTETTRRQLSLLRRQLDQLQGREGFSHQDPDQN
ncbi:MAG TPA: glycosyltransferase [Candidatus Obscuribacterales bacterium]